jgi:hypothetical protein
VSTLGTQRFCTQHVYPVETCIVPEGPPSSKVGRRLRVALQRMSPSLRHADIGRCAAELSTGMHGCRVMRYAGSRRCVVLRQAALLHLLTGC